MSAGMFAVWLASLLLTHWIYLRWLRREAREANALRRELLERTDQLIEVMQLNVAIIQSAEAMRERLAHREVH